MLLMDQGTKCIGHCLDHNYMLETAMDLKVHKDECAENLQDLKNNVVRLTENLHGVQEILKEMKDYNNRQDEEIKDNTKFVYKAIGVIGSMSVFAAMATPIIWVVRQLLERH